MLKWMFAAAAIMCIAASVGYAAAPAVETNATPTWRVLLIIIRNTDLKITIDGKSVSYQGSLTDVEEWDAINSFMCFHVLAYELSGHKVRVQPGIECIEDTVTHASLYGNDVLLGAADISDIIAPYDKAGLWDTIAVTWKKGTLPSRGWGWAQGFTPAGATFLTVTEAPTPNWEVPLRGEIYLHEWLHNVSAFFRNNNKGSLIPPKDADGGDSYGYKRSDQLGWSQYYADLMTCNINLNGKRAGITADTWRFGTPTSTRTKKSSDGTSGTEKVPEAPGNKATR